MKHREEVRLRVLYSTSERSLHRFSFSTKLAAVRKYPLIGGSPKPIENIAIELPNICILEVPPSIVAVHAWCLSALLTCSLFLSINSNTLVVTIIFIVVAVVSLPSSNLRM